jgi:hypothetical protein
MNRILASSFWQWVESMPHAEAIIMPIFFIALTTIVTGGIAINAVHRRRSEIDLKRELLERGMSADEIATVIRATPIRASSSAPALLTMGGYKP